MGTRVDFYVGRGPKAEWLGSYPFDGYPSGVFVGMPINLFKVPTVSEQTWRDFVRWFLSSNADIATTPDMGWPWPWNDSQLTDYAYALDDGIIYGAYFGRSWFKLDPMADSWGEDVENTMFGEEKTCVFPQMRDDNSPPATLGPRSGLIIIGLPPLDQEKS